MWHIASYFYAARSYYSGHMSGPEPSPDGAILPGYMYAGHYSARVYAAGHYGVLGLRVANPIDDISVGGWVPSAGSQLYPMLDEPTADDSDYIYVAGASTCELLLGPITPPAAARPHVLRLKIRCDSGRTLTITLRQGGSTEIASWAHNPAPQTPTLVAHYLNTAQISSITDYEDLRVRLTTT